MSHDQISSAVRGTTATDMLSMAESERILHSLGPIGFRSSVTRIPVPRPFWVLALVVALCVSTQAGLCVGSFAYRLKIYEGDELVLGDYGIVYWGGSGDYPGRVYIRQGPIYLAGWPLDTPRYSLSDDGRILFNISCISEGYSSLMKLRYVVLLVEADWDVGRILTAERYDLSSAGGRVSFDLGLANPSASSFRFDVCASSPTGQVDTKVFIGDVEAVGAWHASPRATTSLRVDATPSKNASSGTYTVLLNIAGELDGPAGPYSHISSLSVQLGLNLHLDRQPAVEPLVLVPYPEMTVEAGETVTFMARLKNTVGERTRFSVQIIPPQGLATSMSVVIGGVAASVVVLEPGEEKDMALSIETSPLIPAGIYGVSVQVSYDGAQLRRDLIVNVTAEIPLYDVEIHPASIRMKADAGQAVYILFSITNRGKLADTYAMSLDTPEGWRYALTLLDGDSAESITLEPRETTGIDLVITPMVGFIGKRSIVARLQGRGGSRDLPIELEISAPDPPTLSVRYPERTVRPGETVRYDLELSNPGPDNVECRLELGLEAPDAIPAEIEWFIDGNPTTRFLVEGRQTVGISVVVHVHANARPQRQSVLVKVSYFSLWLGEGEAGSELVFEIQDAGKEEVGLTTAHPTMTVEAGQRAEFEARLSNMLQNATVFRVGFDAPSGLAVDPVLTVDGRRTDTVILEPGSEAVLRLVVDTPPQIHPGSYEVGLDVWWGSGGSSEKKELTLVLVVLGREPVYDIQVGLAVPRFVVQAGQQACCLFSLYNSGKLGDDYELLLEGPDGWEYSFTIGAGGGTSVRVVHLSPGEKKDVSVCVATSVLDSGSHRLVFEVRGVVGGASCAVPFAIDVEPPEPPRLASSYPDRLAEAGDSIKFQVDVLNPGREPVHFWLNLASDPPIPGTYEVTVDGHRVTHFVVGGGGRSVAEISVDIFTNATPGVYVLNLSGRYSYGDKEAASSQTSFVLLSILVEPITPQYSVQAFAKNPFQTGRAGEQVEFSLKVTNTGKARDTYSLSTNVSSDWMAVFVVDSSPVLSVQLEPGESAEPVLILASPRTAAGRVVVKVRVGSLASGQEETFLVNLAVGATPELDLVLGSLYLDARGGEQTSVGVSVRNRGNTRITNIQLVVDSPTDWVFDYFPLTITELGPGEDRNVTLTFKPPRTAPKGDYSMRIGARSDQVSTEPASLYVSVSRAPGVRGGYVLYVVAAFGIVALVIIFRKRLRQRGEAL